MNKAIDQLCICVYFVSILVPYGQQGFILGAIYLSPLVDHGHNGAWAGGVLAESTIASSPYIYLPCFDAQVPVSMEFGPSEQQMEEEKCRQSLLLVYNPVFGGLMS